MARAPAHAVDPAPASDTVNDYGIVYGIGTHILGRGCHRLQQDWARRYYRLGKSLCDFQGVGTVLIPRMPRIDFMKHATPFAIALILFLPSCTSHSGSAVDPQPASAEATGVPLQNSPSSSEVTPMKVYRGAQQAAGAVNTVRTLGSLF